MKQIFSRVMSTGTMLFMLFVVTDAHATSALFPGLNTFANSMLGLVGVAILLSFVAMLFMLVANGSINWGQMLTGFMGFIVLAGLAANYSSILATFGIPLPTSGAEIALLFNT